MTHNPSKEVMQEIKRLIAFYEARGWDWLMAVSYTASKATGHWPPSRPFTRFGRPRERRTNP